MRKIIAVGSGRIELSALKFPVTVRSTRLRSPASILKKAALFFIFQMKDAPSTGEIASERLTIPKRIVRIFENTIAVTAETHAKTRIYFCIFFASFSSGRVVSFLRKSFERLDER